MGNQQSNFLNEEQKQVLLSGKLGDGCISINKYGKGYYSTNSIHEEYITFKHVLLGNIASKIRYIPKNGYAQTPIYTFGSCTHPEITIIKYMSIPETLSHLTELGIALWLYDDGSLHRDKMFFNLNTHKFSYKEQLDYFIPFFNNLNIYPKILKETKKDGREFYYLYISRYNGGFEITKILLKYPLNCFSYKRWDSETILKWSKLQEQLKSTDKVYNNIQKGVLLRHITL